MCGSFHSNEDLCSTDAALRWSLSTTLSLREGSGGSTSLSLRQLLNNNNLAFSLYNNALSLLLYNIALLLAAALNSPSRFSLSQLLYTNALVLAWARAPVHQARPPPQGYLTTNSCFTISSCREFKLILGCGQWGLERGAAARQLPRLRPRYHIQDSHLRHIRQSYETYKTVI